MKRLAFFLILILSVASAQSPGDLNSGATLARDSDTGSITFSWWGLSGRKYFVQQSEDLKHWRFMPVIELGNDNVISWGFDTDAPRMFFKLTHIEAGTDDPLLADSDGDGVSDWDEVQVGTNPFNQDTDGDGWFDDEEIAMGGNPLNGGSVPVLKPSEEYMRVEVRSVTAFYEEKGGDHTEQYWDWYWWDTTPPTGAWMASSPGTIPFLRETEGFATFSDGRPDLSLQSLSSAVSSLNEVANMQRGMTQHALGIWKVSSAYGETPQGVVPLPPPEDPVYPDGGRYGGVWTDLPILGWNGGALELRLVWSNDSPRAERTTQVTKTFLKKRSKNSQIQDISVHTLRIQPGALHSIIGGPTNNGMVPLKANVGTTQSVAGIQLEESLTIFDFEDEEPCSGLDKVSPEKWLMVPQDGENRVYVHSAASAAVGADVYKLKPSPSDTTYISAQPETLSQSKELVTFGPGGIPGDGEGMALQVNQSTTEDTVLRFAVMVPRVLKIAVHPIALKNAQGDVVESPQSLPSQQDLENFFNKTFGDQSNIACEVVVLPVVGVNWDVGIGVNGSLAGANNRQFEILSTLLPGRPISDEENAVTTASPRVVTADVNVYFIAAGGTLRNYAGMWVVDHTDGTGADPVLGFAGKATRSNRGTVYAWDFPATSDRPNHMWAIAHEAAHYVGNLAHSTFPPWEDNPSYVADTDNELRLMTGEGGEKRATSPIMLVKREWDNLQEFFSTEE